jgi:hypothetical protein
VHLDGSDAIIRCLRVAAKRNRADPGDHPVAGRPSHVVALRNLAVPARRHQQVLAAVAGIRAGHAQVSHPPLVQVQRGTHQQSRRQLDHHRPSSQIQQDRPIGGVGIQRQPHLLRLGVQHPEHLVGGHPDRLVALEHGQPRHRREEEPVGLDSTVQIGVVIGPLDRLRRREPTLEHVRAGRLRRGRHAASTGWLRRRTHPAPDRGEPSSPRPGDSALRLEARYWPLLLVALVVVAVAHRRLGPSSSATTSTTCRALPSSAVHARCWSRPTTTTRLPLASDSAACSAWSRHTITVKNDASPSCRRLWPPGTWPLRCRPRYAGARGRR